MLGNSMGCFGGVSSLVFGCFACRIGRPLVCFEDVLRVLGVLSQRFKLLLLCLDDDTIGYAIFVAIG